MARQRVLGAGQAAPEPGDLGQIRRQGVLLSAPHRLGLDQMIEQAVLLPGQDQRGCGVGVGAPGRREREHPPGHHAERGD